MGTILLLGTALQAAWNARPVSWKIIAALKTSGAKYRIQDRMVWTTAYKRMETTDKNTVQAFKKLFLPQKSITEELSEHQRLFATALDKWKRLPCLWYLEKCLTNLAGYQFPVPFVEQLEDIKRYMSGMRMEKHELESEELLYKALYWAGINHIVENIGPLVSRCMKDFLDDSQLSQKSANGPSKIPEAFLLGLPKNAIKGLSASDLSDLVAMDLEVQRGSYDDEELSSKSGPQRLGLRPGYLATADLLSLVKDLIQFGSKCTQYHRLVNDGREIPYATGVRVVDLMFEVNSVVMRLAAIKDWDHDSIVFQRTVRYLSTIRIPRINDIDSACWKELTLIGMSRETANVQSSLSGQLDSMHTRLVNDVQVSLSALIREEIRNAVAQTLPTQVRGTSGSQAGQVSYKVAEPRSENRT
ncbi:hypothetical protein ASPBRDRAFT_463652 [Aspergillus brasiliensis CBS 101740]|uniref:Uncharacterized protein n=1 Tax=Aspergillus brasiliensis (strain CBS 101740 / IMI 381727 / IBT 21946) TaxID=767769 RepID=A0A1L9UTD3_ASPBC|nr:hypothetical protein ASPBRDRAFT_463652 [Aspergillus brasiliensis CBS 101740]